MDCPKAAIARLCDPAHQVSVHYIIDKFGNITQLVGEAYRAWHAGVGKWLSIDDVNSASIGIELCNDGTQCFEEGQMHALKALLADIMKRWDIPAKNVIGHSDMAPGRKQDPGRFFDWRILTNSGLAVFRGKLHNRKLPFFEAAQQFGYFLPNLDDADRQYAVLEAFRSRFRPEAFGPLNEDDIQIMSDLVQTYFGSQET
jgi:N-acetylmuramoyl-L-alanine amidase